jgi:hypothetical protein
MAEEPLFPETTSHVGSKALSSRIAEGLPMFISSPGFFAYASTSVVPDLTQTNIVLFDVF